MAEVYWIHLPEHSDMFTQGYIGITKTTAKKRFYKHLSVSRSKNTSKSNTILSKALNKYGDRIVLDTIVICSIDYAFDLESKLRPTTRIGWNTDHGGRGRKEISEETRLKISSTLMGHKGVVHSDDTKKRMSEKRLGVPRPPDLADKIRSTLIARGPWNKDDADVGVWLKAELLYSLFLDGLGYTAASNRVGIDRNKACTVFNWFGRGWNPSIDDSWKSWKIGNSEN